jgi:hypothetical protein
MEISPRINRPTKIWVTKFTCLLTNLTSKFAHNIIRIISLMIERNSELSCRFVWMTSANTWESLLNWTHSKPLCLASFTACNNTHSSPSSVDKPNYCHCVSPAVNSSELLRKHASIVVLPNLTKNTTSKTCYT